MIRTLTLATTLALAARALAAPGTPIDLLEVRQNLFATCVATDREGWMVGELGRIIRTTDGGQTWVRQDAGTKRPFLAMSCLDAKTAWIAGKEGIIYGTKDGGDTWTQFETKSNRHIFAIEFPTAERGHAVGDFGTMVHTEDGGKSWTTSRVPESVALPESALDTGVEPGDVNLYGISYGDPDHVWVAGEFGIIMASTDGGLTWQQQTYADREHPIRHPLPGHPARLRRRHRLDDPRHRRRRRQLAHARAAGHGSLVLRHRAAWAERMDRRRRGHRAEDHRRRRHLER